MPRGQKECPKCKKTVGPRTHRCECGHEFFAFKLADVTATAGGILPGSLPPPPDLPAVGSPVREVKPAVQQPKPITPKPEANPGSTSLSLGGRAVVLTPAGKPPCKPAGHPWEEGQVATDDQIGEWAEQVRMAGLAKGVEYAPEAVCYFARYFWDIHDPEYRRVREVIRQKLV